MRRILMVVVLVGLATPAMAGPYLFELLEIKAYRAGFDQMLKGEKKLPAWVTRFSKDLDGVASPSEDLDIAGQTYSYATVCKPHDCGGNLLYVVFDGEGKAYGLLEGGGDAPEDRYLGKPETAIAEALSAEAERQ